MQGLNKELLSPIDFVSLKGIEPFSPDLQPGASPLIAKVT